MSVPRRVRALVRASSLAVALVAAGPVTSLLARPADDAVVGTRARFDIQLAGQVTDSTTGAPLEGAQVLVDGTRHGTVTAASGRYQLVVPGVARGARLTVVVRRIGYVSARRAVRADSARTTLDVTLTPSVTQLQTQRITAGAAPRVERSTTGSSVAIVDQAKGVAGTGQAGTGPRQGRPGSRTESSSNTVVGQAYDAGSAPTPAPGPVPARTGVVAGGVVAAPAAPTGDIAAHLRRRSGQWNTEEYAHIVDNPFLGARQNPLSTFSIDVDRASYANVRRYIGQGQLPPRDAVRIEELVNYFRYDYDGPRGRHPVAIHTELAAAPWEPAHQLLRVGVQGQKIDLREAPPNNLVFLIDVSGSMRPENRLPLLKRAFAMLVDELREEDRVSIVVYAGAAGLVLPPTSGASKRKIHAALEQLEAGGSTAGRGNGATFRRGRASGQYVRLCLRLEWWKRQKAA